MTEIKEIEKNLKQEARKLLESGAVSVVLAYGRGYDEQHPMPFAATQVSDVDEIVFNEYCTPNMARYLTKYPAGTKMAVAVKGCDSRAVVVLIQEGKVKREDLVILGIPVTGMKEQRTGKEVDATLTCGMPNPVLYDILLGTEIHGESPSPYDVLAELDAKTGDERWAFWKSELSRCIRCYACRKACPMCYCDPCFIDQTKPQWGDKTPSFDGNLMYHLTRFYHLAGRCVDCGECTRACPVNIPLNLFHKYMARECEEMFNQKAGMDVNAKPVMVDFKVEDSDTLIE
ncbi:MAG: 4Fe-4S binding domain protein [Syntrophaceae bacterium PtaU1.Bin231]|nr:MAG: 4Fe-4S binding domain protein [Syntrophaceae bacterium PtaU1.Bin231]